MCTEVEGIDVLITGHQHRSIAGELNGVTIIQPIVMDFPSVKFRLFSKRKYTLEDSA